MLSKLCTEMFSQHIIFETPIVTQVEDSKGSGCVKILKTGSFMKFIHL